MWIKLDNMRTESGTCKHPANYPSLPFKSVWEVTVSTSPRGESGHYNHADPRLDILAFGGTALETCPVVNSLISLDCVTHTVDCITRQFSFFFSFF